MCVHSRHVAAQVNMEALRGDPFHKGWGLAIDANASLSGGNVELIDLGAAASLRYQTFHGQQIIDKPEKKALAPFVYDQLLVHGNARYAEKSDAAFVSQSFSHMRWTRMWHRHIGSELFLQHQYNQFWRLTSRAVGGAGVRIDQVHYKNLLVFTGHGYMFESERINVAQGALDKQDTLNHRMTNYLTIRGQMLDELLLAQNTTYYQPRFDRWDDYRVLNETEAQLRITTKVSVAWSFALYFDSRPPSDVRKTDVRFLNTLRVTL